MAVAVCAALVAMLVGAGSARVLPRPTRHIVAVIVRAVTPFDIPEHKRPEDVPSSEPSPATGRGTEGSGAGTSEGADTPALGISPQAGSGRSTTNEPQVKGSADADRGSQPSRVNAPPTPATTVAPGPPPAQPVSFSADLRGAVGDQTPGDPDGQGRAVLEAKPGADELCLTVDASGIAAVTATHVHAGSAGVTGPVAATFAEPTDTTSARCVTVDHQQIEQIEGEPQDFYVDVHTDEFPNGALRGQLTN